MAVYLAAEPRIHDMPPTVMAVVRPAGDPSLMRQPAVAALRSAVTILGGAMGALRTRQASEANGPAAWALPVAATTTEVPQLALGCPIALETWDYGTVAEILHEGPLATLQGSIDVLLEHIALHGYGIVGPQEQEYLTDPTAPLPRTVVRYQVAPIG